jgi:hypothetical protein
MQAQFGQAQYIDMIHGINSLAKEWILPARHHMRTSGFPVRSEKFTRPKLSHQPTDLNEDTIDVLVHMFKTKNPEDRDVGILASNLGLEGNVSQYHLDRLQDAKLAESTGFNYMLARVYWGLTAEGRRYAMEHKLV